MYLYYGENDPYRMAGPLPKPDRKTVKLIPGSATSQLFRKENEKDAPGVKAERAELAKTLNALVDAHAKL